MKARIADVLALMFVAALSVSAPAFAAFDVCRDLASARERALQVDTCQAFVLPSLNSQSQFKGNGCDLMGALTTVWQQQLPLVAKINSQVVQSQALSSQAAVLQLEHDVLLLRMNLMHAIHQVMGPLGFLTFELSSDPRDVRDQFVRGFRATFRLRWQDNTWFFEQPRAYEYELPIVFDTVSTVQYRACLGDHCRGFTAEGRALWDSELPPAPAECPLMTSER